MCMCTTKMKMCHIVATLRLNECSCTMVKTIKTEGPSPQKLFCVLENKDK